ncbi:putative ribonuclease H-like domain-containing protein [Tanacetum coccineum]
MKFYYASNLKVLDKIYDRFQKLISQLEIHGEVISQEDTNLKLLRSLPSAWNNIALIIRNKADLDELSMDDLYNNLKVYNTAHDVPATSPQLDNEDLEQIDTDDLEEMDLKWLNVTTATGEVTLLESAGHQEVRGNRNGDAPRRIVPVKTPVNALVVQDGICGYDWSYQAEEGPTDFALMAHLSSASSRIIFQQHCNQSGLSNQYNTAKQSSPRAATSISNAMQFILPALKTKGNPQYTLQDQGIFDSGCSRHMTGNKSFLTDYQEIDGGFVAFGGSPKGGKITGKGKIRTGKLDFEDVYFVKELKFNLFSVSQMCDKKNSVLFTETECLVLSPDFKLLDESQVLLKVPRQNNMYSFDLKNVVPSGGLTCLFAKATIDESNLWHRRLGHINFKTMNKLVRGNLVRGLPSKLFENDHTCVACQKGKQHKASCKTKLVSSISQPLQMLHMDLFGPTSVRSINHKTYCLVVTDDYSRFSWVFFLATKDETSGILKTFITGIENQINHKVKIIRCDNGTEFKNNDMNQFCGMKGIKREFSVARTSQQNGAEAVNIACYVQNMVLVTKFHNKTPYELILGRPPSISFMRPFGCLVTILNILDPLGKFDRKADEGFLVGYSINSKTFRVFNTRTRKVEENLHINFLENKPNVAGSGPEWLFDIDSLTKSMNYEPITAENQTNGNAGIETNVNTGQAGQEKASDHEYILLPLRLSNSPLSLSSQSTDNKDADEKEGYANNTNRVATVNPFVSTAGQGFDNADDQERIDSSTQDVNIVGPKPKKVIQALTDLSWIEAMQEELLQFKLQKVWTLVDLPKGKRAIGTKIKAIRLFLAYASFMGLIMYQMDVKSAFLYGTIEDEVTEVISYFLYVDDIIFGSLCVEFEQMMHKRFQMSSIRVLTFFLGLQVQQKGDGIFISQDKYVADILKKFDFTTVKAASTPIETHRALNNDECNTRPEGHRIMQRKLAIWCY